jgi:NDP-sugar pyrophosphorylase family protein
MQTVILAGGLGTRLRPVTEDVPKAMVEIGGQPFVDHQLRWLASCGVREVVFAIGFRGDLIREFVGGGSRWGLQANYVDEGDDLRGTGGALRLAADRGVLQDRFLVTYGDSFLPVDFGAVWKQFLSRREPALMTVLNNGDRWDTSNACFDGDKVTLYDKNAPPPKPSQMRFIDYGLSAFRKSVIVEEVPSGAKADLADLFHRLSLRGELAGFEVGQRFYEIGSFQGIRDFEEYLKKPRGSIPSGAG